MAIANLTKAIALVDSDFLGLPVNHHISDGGYWYTYHPADLDSNNVIVGNAITLHEWDAVVSVGSSSQISSDASRVELDGTISFIDDSHDNGTLRYHGGCIQRIGPGVNDITNLSEDDAFFFAHIGTYGDNGQVTSSGTANDDAFYWDRMYSQTAGGDWDFYQYHKHLPSNYSKYDDGRIVFDADGYIRPADKQYGYLINILAKSGGSSYSVPLARIHTPSVGGAHNSHNDVTLPNVAGINYLPGGIIRGGSNRIHAFYLSSAGASGWNLFSRTYTSSSGSFTAEVNYGASQIADADFVPYPGGDGNAEGTQSSYAFRASAGHTFGSKVYVPVTTDAIARSYTQEVTDIVGGGVVYAITGNDREGAHAERNQPTIYMKVGDTLTFENSQYLAHPMWIRTNTSIAPSPSSHNVAGATGGGSGGATLTFTPTAAGTVYYVCALHNGMNGEIVVTDLDGTFDQQIFTFTDANTISPGTLVKYDLPFQFHGLPHKPDCYITSVATRLYIAASSGIQGGVQLFSAEDEIDSDGAITFEGNIVTNDSDEYLRIHGFKYNANTTKFFTLVSGVDGAAGNYAGRGLYSFDLAGGSFDGYDHMSYDGASGGFVTRKALQSGHLRYDHPSGTIAYDTGLEPEGIPTNTSVMQWETASPQFFNKSEVNTGSSEEYYFQGIYLEDGRKALCGRLEAHPETLGATNTGDLLLTIVDNENKSVSYTWGGTGDNFITGIIEDKINNKIVMSGYSKGELAKPGDQWVHGWGRNLHQSSDSADMAFLDIARDSASGKFYVVGEDNINGRPVMASYDKDYILTDNLYFDVGAESTNINSIDILNNRYAVTSGWTKNSTGKIQGYLNKINLADNTIDWSYGLYQGTNINAVTDQCVITNDDNEYIIGFLENNLDADSDAKRAGLIFLADLNGNITVSKSTDGLTYAEGSRDLHIKRIKEGKPGTGDFFFVGSETSGNYRLPVWGYGNVLTSDLIHYIQSFTEASGIATNSATDWDRYENSYEDIDVLKYYPDSDKYDIIAIGKRELSPGVADYVDPNYAMRRTDPIASKWTIYKEDTSVAVHNTTLRWFNTYQAHYGELESFTSLVVEDSDRRDWWKNEENFFHNGNVSCIIGGTGFNLDSDGIHPDYSADILMGKDTFFMAINDDDGSITWMNTLGHMGADEINKSTVWDGHNRNFVTVGKSSSHSVGTDAVLFRLWKDGFGTGVYHTSVSTSNAYYYDSTGAYLTAAGTWPADSSSFPDLSLSSIQKTTLSTGLSTNVDNTVPIEYNGSYGANGLFTGFMAIVDQKDLQDFKNTAQYIKESQEGKIVHRVGEDFFKIHQVSTVGDATADDGNIFSYDVIKSRDQEYYYLGGQVSGNVAQTNSGQAGVYDYQLFQWNIAAEQFRFWQAGTALDEEIYGITELAGTSLLVTLPPAVGQGRQNGTVEWTPTIAGTYYYQCGLHSAMGGQIVVTNTQSGVATHNISVTANGSAAYQMSGTDRNGAINASANNPTITIDTGDFLRFAINSSGHPFYIQTAAGTGGSKNGHIAFCGRTTGQLGTDIGSSDSDTPLFGGYDLFLGIFDPNAWAAEYYNQGSGFNDKAMNLHDLHPKIPNTLALVYTSFGSVNNATTFGSEDIGVITFNYDTDSWSKGFQIGSETSEEIDQNGKPSTLLPDGRVAIVCNTAGTFADNSITYGLKDMGLGIFDFDSDGFGNYAGWSKYQIGSGSADFSYSIDNNGSSFLITGYSEATWDKSVSGVFVEFDPERNILGKSA